MPLECDEPRPADTERGSACSILGLVVVVAHPPTMLIAVIVYTADAMVVIIVRRIDAYPGAERPKIHTHLGRRRRGRQSDKTGDDRCLESKFHIGLLQRHELKTWNIE